MKELCEYILEQLDFDFELTASEKRKLLQFDKMFNDAIMTFREEHNGKDILNFKEEKEKFLKKYHASEKYYPIIKFEKDKIEPSKMKKQFTDLLYHLDMVPVDCILYTYYKQCINFYITVCEHLERKYKGDYFTVQYHNVINEDIYKEAEEILKNTKYVKGVSDNRDKDAEYAKKKIEEAIKECGFDWEVKIYDNMVPRMNVLPNGIVRINKNAKFSDVDIDGLIAHEIKGHVGRRYYGHELGLYLFVHGLPDRNVFDEGLAVWNSLNLCKEPKPNILYNIALKCFIAYNAQKMDIYELFELCKKTCPDVEEEKLIGALLRNKRDEVDTRLKGGDLTDASYFIGYKMIDDMTDKQRDDILHYNIGPEQLHALPDIKKFFEANEFKPLPIK